MVDKVPPSSSSMQRMRHVFRFILLAAGSSLLLLTGCTTARVAAGKPYHVTAYRPHDPSAVKVKVSLAKENIYVMEGDRWVGMLSIRDLLRVEIGEQGDELKLLHEYIQH